MSRRALLALGSNLGDRWSHLRGAVAALPDVVEVSAVYETAPVGGPDQGPYLNCVVRLETDLDARGLLEVARTGSWLPAGSGASVGGRARWT